MLYCNPSFVSRLLDLDVDVDISQEGNGYSIIMIALKQSSTVDNINRILDQTPDLLYSYNQETAATIAVEYQKDYPDIIERVLNMTAQQVVLKHENDERDFLLQDFNKYYRKFISN